MCFQVDDERGWKEKEEDMEDPGQVQRQQRGHKKPFRCSINTRVGRDQLAYSSSPGIHTNKPNNDNNNKVWA